MANLAAVITFVAMWAALIVFFYIVIRFVLTHQRQHAELREKGKERPPFEFGL